MKRFQPRFFLQTIMGDFHVPYEQTILEVAPLQFVRARSSVDEASEILAGRCLSSYRFVRSTTAQGTKTCPINKSRYKIINDFVTPTLRVGVTKSLMILYHVSYLFRQVHQ